MEGEIHEPTILYMFEPVGESAPDALIASLPLIMFNRTELWLSSISMRAASFIRGLPFAQIVFASPDVACAHAGWKSYICGNL